MDSDLTPHPERVTPEYAERRIREKIESHDDPRAQAGLRNVDAYLKDADVHPSVRLHYITAITHLGRHAAREPHGHAERVLVEEELHPRGVPKE